MEFYQLFYDGKSEPVAPKVAESTPLQTRERKLLDLFRRMPESDKSLFLGLAREAEPTTRPDNESPLEGANDFIPQYHFNLARWLETKGDREETLGEYRTAYTLDPQNLGFKGAYEGFLQKVNAARQQENLQHWLGTWVLAGPVKFSAGCGGRWFPLLARDILDYSFKVLTISPSGEVAARVEHPPLRGDESARPDWSGIASETTLVIIGKTHLPKDFNSHFQWVMSLAPFTRITIGSRSLAKVRRQQDAG